MNTSLSQQCQTRPCGRGIVILATDVTLVLRLLHRRCAVSLTTATSPPLPLCLIGYHIRDILCIYDSHLPGCCWFQCSAQPPQHPCCSLLCHVIYVQHILLFISSYSFLQHAHKLWLLSPIYYFLLSPDVSMRPSETYCGRLPAVAFSFSIVTPSLCFGFGAIDFHHWHQSFIIMVTLPYISD
ncbi:hypothetical protein ASPBRDRAFT_434545 [Aspergillus brasiliensis CBS 101740]|uniref:Uncharacterized protein n=1 Tax=Aspergillus brasiliensis (strain CBS 101740 / IMI 381727 / IBT 21946) TaxID=767769 RepID=A0A1L9U2S6_ASPBC|nr:hypothetical protein ASPBRDRAFT_434545 [Aspergillus brasiliensis CBS 101740]